MQYTHFYSELGKLLYAIANIDKKISPQEKKKLISLIQNELIESVELKDQFGTPVAYYPEIEFEYLDEEIIDAETAFGSFLDYIENHKTAIDYKMRYIALHFAKELAKSSYGINKKEKALLDRLKKKLEELG